MNYDCTLAAADKIALDPRGVMEPLCNKCQAPDCSNPIRDTVVYVIGIPRMMRLYTVNNVVKQVVACKGYVGESNASLSKIEEELQKPSAPIRRDYPKSKQGDS